MKMPEENTVKEETKQEEVEVKLVKPEPKQ